MTMAPARFQPPDARERDAQPARPRLPGLRAVLREQIRAAGVGVRGPAVIAAALAALVTVVVALQRLSMGVVVNLYEWPTLAPGLMGALLPIAVWGQDERFGPSFLWTLPVDRRRHALIKVAAGWVWLMVGIAVFASWLGALTLVSGGLATPPELLHLLPPADPETGPIDPAVLRSAPWSPGPLIWAVPFTGATAIYLLASAFLLGSRHPLRWIVGIALGYALMATASDAAAAQLGAGWLADLPGSLMQLLVESRYGLDALLTARTGTLSTTLFLTTGERALVWRAVPDLADWRIATAIWTGAGLVALWAASSRHRERRRS